MQKKSSEESILDFFKKIYKIKIGTFVEVLKNMLLNSFLIYEL